VLDGVPDPPWEWANFGERGAHCKVSAVSCAKTAEPIKLPFGLWIWVDRRKHKFNRICKVATLCPDGKAHWRHLANTIELSICGGDALLCQVTLTACCFSLSCTSVALVLHSSVPGMLLYDVYVFVLLTYDVTCVCVCVARSKEA